jgi:hypothetical protein
VSDVVLMIIGLGIIMAWPQVALWLPGTMLNVRG